MLYSYWYSKPIPRISQEKGFRDPKGVVFLSPYFIRTGASVLSNGAGRNTGGQR